MKHQHLNIYQNFEIRSSQYVELNQDGWESVTPAGNFALVEDLIVRYSSEDYSLDQIILLDETMVKIRIVEPGSGFTLVTTINYTLQNNEFQLPIFASGATVELSDDLKTMELCNFTYYHTKLSSQFPQITHSAITNNLCTRLDGADPIEYVKDQFNWIPGDTIAIVFSAFVYELQ